MDERIKDLVTKLDRLVNYVEVLEQQIDNLHKEVNQSYNINFIDRIKYQIFRSCKGKL
jgi:cell division protein FtsB